ncbi:hypothetical protein LCGC14_2387030 [marine sediment metagenome]|uniref:Uncharacterized protein n=1 Tax=marine sediment metagenome TaxID=412755 RepID=A0A0F9BZH3_9ZZZZ
METKNNTQTKRNSSQRVSFMQEKIYEKIMNKIQEIVLSWEFNKISSIKATSRIKKIVNK